MNVLCCVVCVRLAANNRRLTSLYELILTVIVNGASFGCKGTSGVELSCHLHPSVPRASHTHTLTDTHTLTHTHSHAHTHTHTHTHTLTHTLTHIHIHISLSNSQGTLMT